ncbi:alpha/beta fold hydrolase [Kushneria indalinina]|uniref:Peroxiredoxin n=1 Tax=Kushneria indalinina DSM 14324 TaxID=1122140 RepID=A0A3D9DZM7_9GAMM|nr:alpha/beta hydrolase [Kushneria indalinina]REC96171.1 peroxiredoxin [Kushneria indalinina DSM 14324]
MAYANIIDSNNNAIDLYYQDCGQGPTVVLIHGWPLSHRMWEYQINALTEAGYRCIAYDRRGFGESEKPWQGYDYDTLADDLAGLLEHLNIDDATLVGFSMGGGEVARYLGRHGSKRVRGAVLVGAVPPFMLKTGDNPEGVDQSIFDDMLTNVKQDRPGFLGGFGKLFVNHDGQAPTLSDELLAYNQSIANFASPRATQECIKAFGFTDFRQDLEKFDVPTLVIHGDDDQIVPLAASGQRSADMIKNARLEVVKDGPHGLNFTHAQELNRLLIDFLEKGR